MKWKLITVESATPHSATARTFMYSLVVHLHRGRFTPGAVQLIQLAESTLSPDAEASNVTSRGEPEKVQFVHVLQSDTCTTI